jgi:hypothetical protein
MVPTTSNELANFFSFPSITYDPNTNLAYKIGIAESIMVPMCVYLVWQSLYCFLILDLNREKVHDGF